MIDVVRAPDKGGSPSCFTVANGNPQKKVRSPEDDRICSRSVKKKPRRSNGLKFNPIRGGRNSIVDCAIDLNDASQFRSVTVELSRAPGREVAKQSSRSETLISPIKGTMAAISRRSRGRLKENGRREKKTGGGIQ